MSLVAIASSQTESELSVMLCTLEAHGIRAFVQGGGFGSLFPGPQVASYNARRIMVSSSDVPKAIEALAVFSQPEPISKPTHHRPRLSNILRMVIELFMFGWFIPGNRNHQK